MIDLKMLFRRIQKCRRFYYTNFQGRRDARLSEVVASGSEDGVGETLREVIRDGCARRSSKHNYYER